jgi:hypothetical protein
MTAGLTIGVGIDLGPALLERRQPSRGDDSRGCEKLISTYTHRCCWIMKTQTDFRYMRSQAKHAHVYLKIQLACLAHKLTPEAPRHHPASRLN